MPDNNWVALKEALLRETDVQLKDEEKKKKGYESSVIVLLNLLQIIITIKIVLSFRSEVLVSYRTCKKSVIKT